MKRVRTAAVFDLDHTITRIDTYANFLLRMILRRPTRWLSASTLVIDAAYSRLGYRDNEWLKQRALTRIGAGATAAEVEIQSVRLTEAVVRSQIPPAARAAIEQHRRADHRLVLATASFDFYVKPMARALGFNDVVCTLAEWDAAGCLTGRIVERNCYAEEKRRRVAALFGRARQDWHIIAYSDHHSDLPLLEWSNVARVVNPSKLMRRLAQERGFPILEW
jgi:HAD superfamily hydrolase (TIGR01490 family)